MDSEAQLFRGEDERKAEPLRRALLAIKDLRVWRELVGSRSLWSGSGAGFPEEAIPRPTGACSMTAFMP